MKNIFTLFGLCLCQLLAAQTNPIQEAMNNYDYEKAISLIEQKEATPQLLMLKAQALKGLLRYTEAAKAIAIVTKAEPENIQVLLEQAECNRLAGNFSEALRCYEQVIALKPDNKFTRLQQANLLFATEKYQETLSACNELLKTDNNPIIMRLMAQSYENLTVTDSAAVYYKKTIELNPADYIAVARLARLYIDDKRFPEAIAITNNYRDIDSLNLYVNRQNAQAYCLSEQYEEAIRRYEALVQSGDNSMMTFYYLGMSYFANEEFYEAHNNLMKAYKYDPKSVNLLYYLARACAKTSWKKEAVKYMDMALDLTIPTPETLGKLYEGLAECHFMNGEYKEQLAAVKEQYKHTSKNNLLYRMGYIYQDLLKDNRNAEKYLEMYLKTRPKEPPKVEGVMEGGTLMLGENTVYRAAEKRLEAIRMERFWKEGADKDSLMKKE